ncbi:MAG: hypothetical protein GQ570_15165 [Helicobacteraceae bacterium]|nr:hypothetical protein [Helicobacteraceae bacterium]
MTYLELKNHVEGLLLGDKKIPKHDLLVPLIKQGIEHIANECTPLSLMTSDVEDDILIVLNVHGQFIRKPVLPVEDTDEIDLDNSLLSALSNLVAFYISKNPTLEISANTYMCDYKWVLYRAMEANDYDV